MCGPVVDIVEQAKAQAPHGVAFIHQEIYQDNNANKPLQGPVAAWQLPDGALDVRDRPDRAASRRASRARSRPASSSARSRRSRRAVHRDPSSAGKARAARADLPGAMSVP